jgi:hypothetical protein
MAHRAGPASRSPREPPARLLLPRGRGPARCMYEEASPPARKSAAHVETEDEKGHRRSRPAVLGNPAGWPAGLGRSGAAAGRGASSREGPMAEALLWRAGRHPCATSDAKPGRLCVSAAAGIVKGRRAGWRLPLLDQTIGGGVRWPGTAPQVGNWAQKRPGRDMDRRAGPGGSSGGQDPDELTNRRSGLAQAVRGRPLGLGNRRSRSRRGMIRGGCPGRPIPEPSTCQDRADRPDEKRTVSRPIGRQLWPG